MPRGSALAESRLAKRALQQPDQEEDDHDHEQRSCTDVHVVSFLLSQPSHQTRSSAAATTATIAQMTSATPPRSTNGVPEARPRATVSSVVSVGGGASSAATSSVGGRVVARRHGAVGTQRGTGRNGRTFGGPSSREPEEHGSGSLRPPSGVAARRPKKRNYAGEASVMQLGAPGGLRLCASGTSVSGRPASPHGFRRVAAAGERAKDVTPPRTARRRGIAVFAPVTILTITLERASDGHEEVHVHPGGQGVWQARMARTLGAPVTLCTLLGGEPGAVLDGLLDGEGIEHPRVEMSRAEPDLDPRSP